MKLTAAGTLVCALRGSGEIYILDASDSLSPQLAASLSVAGANSLLLVEDRLFVAAADQLLTWDLSNPAAPLAVGSSQTGGSVLAADADWLVLGGPAPAGTAHQGCVSWFDISGPLPSFPVSSVLVPQLPLDFAISGDIAYTVLDKAGVMPISPLGPVGGTFVISGEPANILMAGDCLAVMQRKGLSTIPLDCDDIVSILVSQFAASVTRDGVRLTWHAGAPLFTNDFRLEAQQGRRSWLVPVARTDGRQFTALDTAFEPQAGVVEYRLLAYTDGAWHETGRHEVDPSADVRLTRLFDASPNPFNPRTDVAFSLARAQRIRLDIYDLAGRKLAVLADGPFGAGMHAVAWSGRDDKGRELSSGTYLLRLTSEDGLQTRKLTLVR